MFSSRWRVLALLMALIFVMVVVSACGGTDNRQEEAEQAGQQEELEQQREELEQMQEEIEQQQQELEQQQQEAEQQGDQGQQAADSGADDNGAQEDEGAEGAGGGIGSGNVYQVGPAGEVELRGDNGRLVLVDARPNQGWRVEDVEEEADEVELDFVRGNEEWKFEAELEEGQIDVEIERDFDD